MPKVKRAPRFGDALRIGVEPRIINEYLEAEVSQYKTSRAKDRRRKALIDEDKHCRSEHVHAQNLAD
eukprot:3031847-Amphidinium_carterae.1